MIKLYLTIPQLLDGKKFEGSEGKDVQLELGKGLIFERVSIEQLVNVKKNDIKTILNASFTIKSPKKRTS